MNKDDVIEKLRDDAHYYGDFGKKYLSNSDISALLTNPLALGKPSEPRPAFLVGGYFHTAILEPDKLKKYKVRPSSTRNTKVYKEMSGGELCLLQHEVDLIEKMRDKVMSNRVCKDFIQGTNKDSNIDFEVPGIKEIEGNFWKGKADIVNHDEKFIVDLKTTNDINNFRSSAFRYNYDSQAYIYNQMFGYEFLFIVVDKNTHQIGIFDCSPKFYDSGLDKVRRATEVYDLFYKTKDFDATQYFVTKTL